MIIGIITFFLTGLLEMLISIPLIQGRVPRNSWYGFRTPKTLASDEVWYPANAYAGKMLFAAGLVLLIVSVIMFVFRERLEDNSVAMIGLAATLVPIGVAVWLSFRYLKAL